MGANDAILFERWRKRGDAEAFAEIVSRYSGMVYATCRRVLRNPADAQDAAQECFIELMRARVEPSPTLGPWLHTVAVRRSLDRFKSARRRRQREMDHPQGQETVQTEPETSELLALIDEAIAELPETLRGLVVGRFLENRTHVDLATADGISEATVRYRLNKGIERVRTFLKRRGVSVSASALAAVMGSELVESAPLSLNAALGKLALGGALPSMSPVVPAAAKASVFKALTATKAGAFLAVLVLVASVAGLMYMTVNLSGNDVAATLAKIDDQDAHNAAGQSTTASHADTAVPLHYAAAVKPVMSLHEDPIPPKASPAKPQPKPCSISGFIYDDKGQGIPGARVSAATWYSGSDFRSMRVWYGESDASGQYNVSGVLLTSYEDCGSFFQFADVSVSAAGFRTDGKRVDIKEGEELTGVDFRLSAGVNLNARLLDRSGQPVPGAAVVCRSMDCRFATGSASGSTNYHIASTDPDGAFTMGFRDEGLASLLVVSPDRGECFFPAIPIGEPESIDLQMTEPASLSGTITYADGMPAADVSILLDARYAPDGGSPDFAAHVDSSNASEISPAYARNAITRQDGTYTFANIPAVPDLVLQFNRDPSGEKTVGVKLFVQDAGPVEPGENKTWNCTLPSKAETMTIQGRVLGQPSGKPVSSHVSYQNRKTQASCCVPIDPGSDGTYELVLSTPGTYDVWARYASATFEDRRQENGRAISWEAGSTHTIDFQLPDPFAMSIRVVDASGEPVQGAEVEGVVGPIYVGDTKTDADGRYGWDGFAPGVEAHFTISKDGYLTTESQRITGESGAVYPEETIVLYAADGLEGVPLTPDGTSPNTMR
jgi:RNA polymerase sigma factor (sigma-70 family)